MKRNIVSLLCVFSSLCSAQIPFWQKMDGPYGGIVSCIAVSPNNHFFAGAVGPNGIGIYRSTDGGMNWTSTNNYPTSYIWASALAINSNGHIFAGSDYNGAGMFRSMDDGTSWTQINSGLTARSVTHLAINASGHIFAGASGVARSTNNGESWTSVNAGLGGRFIYGLAVNSHGHLFVATFDSGMFRSTNSGDSWRPINSGIAGANPFSLAINSSDHVFVGTYDGRVFRSTTNGESWSLINNGLPSLPTNAFVTGADGQVLAATRRGMFVSSDNGDTWVQKNAGLSYQVLSLALDSSRHFIAGTFGGGVCSSSDNGETWLHTSKGLVQLDVSVVRVNSQAHLFAVSDQGHSLRWSMDGGDNWVPVDSGIIDRGIQSFAVSARDYMYVASDRYSFRSSNNGRHWVPINPFHSPIQTFITCPNGDVLAVEAGTMYAGLHRSTNDGMTWSRIFTSQKVVTATYNTRGHIFVAASSYEPPTAVRVDRVYRSTDNGNQWVDTYFEILELKDFATTSNGHIFAGGLSGIFRSTTNGDTWTMVNGPLRVNAFVVNSRDHLFAATSGGVSRSLDDGLTWTQFNFGLPNSTSINTLALDSTGRVLAGTDLGIFRSIESTTAIEDSEPFLPSSPQLLQNHPNPFNPKTTIEFDLPQRSQVKLIVYDILGREVKKLIEETRDSGKHSLSFDASQLSSGVYFYRLIAGGYVQTRKMIVQK